MFKKKVLKTLLTICTLFAMTLGIVATAHAEDILVQSATVNNLPVISP